MATRAITPEEEAKYLKALQKAKAEDEALGGNYPHDEKGEGIDPTVDVVAIFVKKKAVKE